MLASCGGDELFVMSEEYVITEVDGEPHERYLGGGCQTVSNGAVAVRRGRGVLAQLLHRTPHGIELD
jgi:hypothetical protein